MVKVYLETADASRLEEEAGAEGVSEYLRRMILERLGNGTEAGKNAVGVASPVVEGRGGDVAGGRIDGAGIGERQESGRKVFRSKPVFAKASKRWRESRVRSDGCANPVALGVYCPKCQRRH